MAIIIFYRVCAKLANLMDLDDGEQAAWPRWSGTDIIYLFFMCPNIVVSILVHTLFVQAAENDKALYSCVHFCILVHTLFHTIEALPCVPCPELSLWLSTTLRSIVGTNYWRFFTLFAIVWLHFLCMLPMIVSWNQLLMNSSHKRIHLIWWRNRGMTPTCLSCSMLSLDHIINPQMTIAMHALGLWVL